MPQITPLFNLLDEPWIPVLRATGKTERVGTMAALTEAHTIRAIATSSPMDRVAVLRFLLALLYWCRGNPPGQMPPAFPEHWFDKLRQHGGSWDLFGEGQRFYQTSDCDRRRPVTDLMQEIPTANNFAHFAHVVDYRTGLCAACCAMGLLRLPLFATSGLGGVRAGINGTPPVYLIPTGASLRDTLTASWSPTGDLGEPSWVTPLYSAPNPEAVPVLTGLTMLARRVRLHIADPEGGTCARCGAVQRPIVRDCECEGAPDQKTSGWADPHVVYAADTGKATTPPNPMAAGRFVTDRPWALVCARALGSGRLTGEQKPGQHCAGAYATNKALGVDTWERSIRSPSDVVDMPKAHELLAAWSQHGRGLAQRVARGRCLGPATIAQVRPHVEHLVSQRSAELLTPDMDAWCGACEEYAPLMLALARSVAPGATVAATYRRRYVAAGRPRLEGATHAADDQEDTNDDQSD